jgi:PAS domain S-box-containing protein
VADEGLASRDAGAGDEPAWFRSALDAMLDLVAVQRAVRNPAGEIVDFDILYMNKVDTDVAGRPREELIGRRLLDLYPAMAPLLPRYAHVVDTGGPLTIDELPYEDNIDEADVSGYFTLQVSKFGDGIIVVSRDVTQQRLLHSQLAETVAQFDAVQQLANMGVWTLDLATREVWFSAELRRIFGLGASPAVLDADQLLSLFFAEDQHPAMTDARRRMEALEGPIQLEVRIRRADGAIRRLQIHGDVVTQDGTPTRLWGSAQDVTAQRMAEEALVAARLRLREQRHLVEALQTAILPVAPDVPGLRFDVSYFPASGPGFIGGDWYDVFVLPDGQVGLVVGDVVGHGLPAASAMAQLRNALRCQAFLSASPAEALAKLGYYAARADLDVFATALYVVLDLERRKLSWSHAGHPPGLLRSGGTTMLLEGAGRPPIGFRHDDPFPLYEIELPDDALIVLYTDGLVERRGEMIDVGLERLRGTLAGQPVDGICALLRSVMDAESSEDDICILAAQLVPPGEATAVGLRGPETEDVLQLHDAERAGDHR